MTERHSQSFLLGELAKKFREGDRSAFGELYGRLASQLRAAVIRLLPSVADVEDVVQWTFVRAWEVRSSLKSPERIKSWLCCIARNRAHSLYNRAKRFEAQPEHVEAVADGPRLDDALIEASQRQSLYQELDNLTPRQHQVIKLRALEGLSFKEIASRLGCTSGAARVNFCYGVRILKEQLAA